MSINKFARMNLHLLGSGKDLNHFCCFIMIRHILALTLVAILGTTPVLAGSDFIPSPLDPPQSVYQSSKTKKAYVGLNVLFGNGGPTVEGILGLVYADTDVDGDVTGAKAALHFQFSGGVSSRKFKLTGLNGDEDLQAEIGGGWNFQSGSFFGTLGANGPYAAAGIDYDFTNGLEGYLGVHSIGSFDRDKTSVESDETKFECDLSDECDYFSPVEIDSPYIEEIDSPI